MVLPSFKRGCGLDDLLMRNHRMICPSRRKRLLWWSRRRRRRGSRLLLLLKWMV